MFNIANQPNMGTPDMIMAWWSVFFCDGKFNCVEFGLVNLGEVLTVQDKMVEMQNGCICCTLRDDLIQHVTQLAEEKRFDYLLIETGTKFWPLKCCRFFSHLPRMGRYFFWIVSSFSIPSKPVAMIPTWLLLTFPFNFYPIHFRIYYPLLAFKWRFPKSWVQQKKTHADHETMTGGSTTHWNHRSGIHQASCPLVNKLGYGKWPLIVTFPMKQIVIFHIHVSLPEGIHSYSTIYPLIPIPNPRA